MKIENIKVGFIVHFRCGGKLEVKNVSCHNGVFVNLQFKDFHQTLCYKKGGLKNSLNSFLDIVNIEPPPFDWSSVKVGTPIYAKQGYVKLGDFVGRHPNNLECLVVYDYLAHPVFVIYNCSKCVVPDNA